MWSEGFSRFEALLHSPLLWLLLTLLCWEFSAWLFRRMGQPAWAPPMLTTLTLLVVLLLLFKVDYQTYFAGTQILHFLLGPATVALAVPLYHALPRLLAAAKPLLTVLVAGSILGVVTAVGMAWLLGLSQDTVLAFTTRAVTTPIAVGVAEKIHAPVTLVAAIVIVSGLVGAMLAEPLLKNVKSDMARGFALGLAAHGVGTARAFQMHPTAGAFAALGMGLNGMLTAIWIPPLVQVLLG